jgi:hypothetical protein
LFLQFAAGSFGTSARRLQWALAIIEAWSHVMSGRRAMARQGWHFAIGFQAQQPRQEGAEMIGSDEHLREAEEGLERDSKESDPSDNASQPEVLSDVAPSQPEDVARKILRETFKHFPVPGKK